MESSASPTLKVSKPLLAMLALLPVLILVFFPAMSGPFLLDDSSAIQSNSEIRHVTVSNLIKLVRGHQNVRAVDHHPVSALSMMIDYQWAGLDPFGFHISNLIYHWLAAGAVMMMFLVVWRIHAPMTTEGFWMAASLMFIWSTHPFSTMPVSYITGRQETLLTLFYISSMICLLRGWLAASYLFAIASFLCKEVAVTLPGALYLVDWAQGKTSIVDPFRRRWRFYLVLTTTWLTLCFYHLRGGRSREIGTGGLPLGTPVEYFKAQCGVIAGYVSKLFWPTKLEFYPYIRPAETWTDWLPALLGLILYVGLAVYALRWSRWLAVALIFPILVLSPTSSVIPIPFEPAMEYRMYLPSVALIGLFIVAIWRFVSIPWLRLAIVVAVMAPLATVSHLRTRDYESSRKLYEHDIALNDKNLNALEALGGINLADRRFDEASANSWKLIDWAMSLNNKEFASRGYNTLGLIEFKKSNYMGSKDYYQRSIALNGNVHARFNLATTHIQLKELGAAEKLLKEYLAITPDHPEALLMLYESKMAAHNVDEAEKIFDQFMALYPERFDLDSQRTRMMNMRRNQEQSSQAKP